VGTQKKEGYRNKEQAGKCLLQIQKGGIRWEVYISDTKRWDEVGSFRDNRWVYYQYGYILTGGFIISTGIY